jgi:uncharacterized membrane protein
LLLVVLLLPLLLRGGLGLIVPLLLLPGLIFLVALFLILSEGRRGDSQHQAQNCRSYD